MKMRQLFFRREHEVVSAPTCYQRYTMPRQGNGLDVMIEQLLYGVWENVVEGCWLTTYQNTEELIHMY